MPARSDPPRSALTPLPQGGGKLRVRVTPKAGRAGLNGVAHDVQGQLYLKIAVTVAPDDGKANAAVIALLARHLEIAKRCLRIVSGASDRHKVLHIEGDFATLQQSLTRATLSP